MQLPLGYNNARKLVTQQGLVFRMTHNPLVAAQPDACPNPFTA